jgi:hypothetical protein
MIKILIRLIRLCGDKFRFNQRAPRETGKRQAGTAAFSVPIGLVEITSFLSFVGEGFAGELLQHSRISNLLFLVESVLRQYACSSLPIRQTSQADVPFALALPS